MDTLTIDIDISRPKGRRLVRHLAEYEKYIRVHNKRENEVWHDWEDVKKEGIALLGELYGVDMELLMKKHKLL